MKSKFDDGKLLYSIRPRAPISAFSINANKVYIFYPTTLQDPNMFGKLSIPQNINMEADSNKINWVLRNLQNPSSEPMKQLRRNIRPKNDEDTIKVTNQNADETDNEEVDDKKSEAGVTTHLAGTIVVLNQDVAELNQQQGY